MSDDFWLFLLKLLIVILSNCFDRIPCKKNSDSYFLEEDMTHNFNKVKKKKKTKLTKKAKTKQKQNKTNKEKIKQNKTKQQAKKNKQTNKTCSNNKKSILFDIWHQQIFNLFEIWIYFMLRIRNTSYSQLQFQMGRIYSIFPISSLIQMTITNM